MKILAYILLGGSLGFIILAIIVSLFASSIDDLERERDYYKIKWLEIKKYVLEHKEETNALVDKVLHDELSEKDITLEDIEGILGKGYGEDKNG